ncbi:hypothetical protein KFE25_007519 [Diacronema lutheri]|uniref:UBA domain-containing protein n=1 Tax=Diacronema lutheri TaxID=2081491 RepID=A0A8J5XHH9_DIALT|nr:hypothetical protein KFE25_007519 [Diacronema lutheri]
MLVKLVKSELQSAQVADDAMLAELLDIVARASRVDPADVSLLCNGKRLDSSRAAEPLARLGVVDGATAIVMVKAGAAAGAQVDRAAEDAARRRASLGKAVDAARIIAERHGDAHVALDGGTALTLYNERGQEIELPEADRRGLAIGYMLHAQAKRLLARAQRCLLGLRTASAGAPAANGASADGPAEGAPAAAPAALESVADAGQLVEDASALLEAAHAALDAVDGKVRTLGDNYALVCIDSAWCALLASLSEPSGGTNGARRAPAGLAFSPASLDAAKARLTAAQRQLAELHGPALEKLRSREAEAGSDGDAFGQARATYVRLRLLLGVVAFHEGRVPAARALLASAQALCDQLTLTDDDDVAIAHLHSIGLTDAEARRSLLACGKDRERAAAHAFREREQARALRARDAERAADARAHLGRTRSGQHISAARLLYFVESGFPRAQALDALARADNDGDAALQLLLEPDASAERERLAVEEVRAASLAPLRAHNVAVLVGAGFARADVDRALDAANGDAQAAHDALLAALSAGGARGGGSADGGARAGADANARAEVDDGGPSDGGPKRLCIEDEERTIDESGVVRAMRAAEAAYSACDLSCEAAALALYRARM